MSSQAPGYFFSYSRKDSDFVLRLAGELRAAGALVWVDQLDIVGGDRWDEAVERALRDCPGMVLVLSPQAVASQNFLDEVSYALEERKKVVPVLYQECEVPFRLRRLQTVDFTGDYEAGFSQLCRALGLSPAGAPVARSPAPPSRQARRPVPSAAEREAGTVDRAPAVATRRLALLGVCLALFYLWALTSSCFYGDRVALSAIVGLPLSLFLKWKRPRSLAWLAIPVVSALVGLPHGNAYGSMSRSALFGLEVGDKCQPMTETYPLMLGLFVAVILVDLFLVRGSTD